MLICTHGLNITRWPLHAFGRHLVSTYRHLLPLEVQAASKGASSIREGQVGSPDELAHGASAVPAVPGAAASGVRKRSTGAGAGAVPDVLNVVFQKRAGDTRQILNVQELLQQCNSWRHTTAAGRQLTTKCWQVRARHGVARHAQQHALGRACYVLV